MLYDITLYKKFVKDITDRVPVIHTGTLINALKNYYAENEYLTSEVCMNILCACQTDGRLLLSEDGIALTKGAYMRLVPDDYALQNLSLSRRLRLGKGVVHVQEAYDRALMECAKVAADMMPYSYDFSVGFSPWYIQFIVHTGETDPGILYQVTKVDLGSELTDSVLLRGLPEPYFGWHDYRNSFVRIAILDNPDFAFAIPYLGFSKICIPDNSTIGGLKIVESRDPAERWKDLAGQVPHE